MDQSIVMVMNDGEEGDIPMNVQIQTEGYVVAIVTKFNYSAEV